METWVVMLLASVVFLSLFVAGLSLTLIFKGHHIESEISSNPNMRKLGIRCVVEEAREASGCGSSEGSAACGSSTAGCGAGGDGASGGCSGCSGCGSVTDTADGTPD